MKRALMYATVASMIDLFNMDNIRTLQKLGYKVDVAANFEEGNVTSNERISQFKIELTKMNVDYYHLPIPRTINYSALERSYSMTLNLRDEKRYDLVHCHTPIGSAICRLAFRNAKAKVIYTAHGFHFYKGAPLKNWLLFYPAERFLAKYTNTLITINQEDYINSKKFSANNKVFVPGVGINLHEYTEENDFQNNNLKREIGLSGDDILLVSTGELNENKNHQVVIRAIAKLHNKSIHYAIAGQGPLARKLKILSQKLNIDNQIHVLGYRKDIPTLLKSADVFIFPSFREGLSVSLMEAMASGLPVIATNIRGNRDLIDNNKGGYLLNPNDVTSFSNKIRLLYSDYEKRNEYGLYNLNKIKKYSSERVNHMMEKIYQEAKEN